MVVFVGLLGVATTWATATPPRSWVPLVFILALAVLGLYEFLAALTPSMLFRYPGKKSALIHRRTTNGMKSVLGMYMNRAQQLRRGNPIDNAVMIREWAFALADLARRAWGSHEVTLLDIDSARAPGDQLKDVTENLEELMRRTGSEPGSHFKWDDKAEWHTYIAKNFPGPMKDVDREVEGGE